MINLLHGDCLEQMKTLDDNSVDSIVSDPPYGISFMAKKWDYDVPSVEVWREAMRVLKPGGHALIACGTRTQHRMVVNIEDAGFEIRDVVSWIYGSGFPKSLNISKAIDKAAGAEREVVGTETRYNEPSGIVAAGRDERTLIERKITAPATEAAKQWDGWGSALKPSSEFFTLCRKPLSEKTIAANVLKWGTGGINIDGCRVGTEEKLHPSSSTKMKYGGNAMNESSTKNDPNWVQNTQGRFPANLIHDGSQEVLKLFPETNQGSAARFFYCAKASKKDRNEGLPEGETSSHPTVKPTALMRYLCRLITPAGGTVLDPYMGSGSTGKAAMLEGFNFVGCEIDDNYFDIARSRIENATAL